MFKSQAIRQRWIAASAMLAGAAWTAAGALQLSGRDEFRTDEIETTLDHILLGTLTAALLFTFPVVLALARYARDKRPAYVVAVGQVMLISATIVTNIVGDDPLYFVVVAPLANALWLFGAIALAVSLKRAGEVPKPVAYLLPAVQVVALPLSMFGGGLLAAAYMFAVGYLISVDGLGTRKSTHQPAIA